VSALYEQGKVRHVGFLTDLEDELMAFTTGGFMGEKSPNRADALVWGITELFPGVIKPRKEKKSVEVAPRAYYEGRGMVSSWMGA